MATVFLAFDPRRGHKVAVKVLSPEVAANLDAKLFLQEIEIAARLTHPGVVPLYESGEVDGLLYYVMSYLDGETLRERLAREKQLPVEEAIEITSQVASALDYVHEQGMVHRNLRPEDIYVQSGEAQVADFGLGTALSEAGGQRLKQAGITLGTPNYVSPEQAEGELQVDARSDVYTLGCVTFEMLVGNPPVTAALPKTGFARKSTKSKPIVQALRETVTLGVASAIVKALVRAPADRWSTAGEYAAALKTGLAVTEDLTTPGGGRGRRPFGWFGRGGSRSSQ